MRYLKIIRGGVLSFVLAAFLVFAPARAQTQVAEEGEDARKLLEEATAYQTIPGSYKKVTVKELGGDNIQHQCEYVTIKPDGTRLSRSESELRGEYVAMASIHIINEEGVWALRAKNIAIHATSEALGLELPDEATTARRREAMYRSLEIERVTDKGVKYIKIISRLSDADIAEARAQSEKMMNQTGGIAGFSAKLLSKMMRDKTPARVEYWLDEADHHLVRIRYCNKNGKLVGEEIPGALERVPDLPADMFMVPVGYERIYAASQKEYGDMLKKYPSMMIKVPKESPKQGTP